MRGFSHVQPITRVSGIDPSADGAKGYLSETVSQLTEIHLRGIDRWGMSVRESVIHNAVMGMHRHQPTNMLGSNLRLRLGVGYRAIDMFDAMQKRHPRRRFCLVTLISDRWLAFDRDTYMWLGGMKSAARPVIARGGFDGWLGIVEIQTLDESVRDLGRTLLPHVHAIAWSDDPDFNWGAAQARMQASERLSSCIGAPTADVSFRDDGSACNMVAYLFKAAAVAKYRKPAWHSPSGLVLADCELRPVSAVRQNEILSGMYFDELLFGGGEGASIRADLTAFVRDSVRPGQTSELSTEQAQRFWNKLRRRTGRDEHHYPVEICRDRAQLLSNSPITLANARFTARVGSAFAQWRAPSSSLKQTTADRDFKQPLWG